MPYLLYDNEILVYIPVIIIVYTIIDIFVALYSSIINAKQQLFCIMLGELKLQEIVIITIILIILLTELHCHRLGSVLPVSVGFLNTVVTNEPFFASMSTSINGIIW